MVIASLMYTRYTVVMRHDFSGCIKRLLTYVHVFSSKHISVKVTRTANTNLIKNLVSTISRRYQKHANERNSEDNGLV
jgi:hypothetical protein